MFTGQQQYSAEQMSELYKSAQCQQQNITLTPDQKEIELLKLRIAELERSLKRAKQLAKVIADEG